MLAISVSVVSFFLNVFFEKKAFWNFLPTYKIGLPTKNVGSFFYFFKYCKYFRKKYKKEHWPIKFAPIE